MLRCLKSPGWKVITLIHSAQLKEATDAHLLDEEMIRALSCKPTHILSQYALLKFSVVA